MPLQSRFGYTEVILGPVESEKYQLINQSLDRLVHSGFNRGGFLPGSKVLVVRHPEDDLRDPEHIGAHKVKVTDSVEEIYRSISPQTGLVFIVGASHYGSPEIVDLADAIVRSNRRLTLSGLNLDAKGQPYGFMSALVTLADKVSLVKAVCHQVSTGSCYNIDANRSRLEENKYVPSCTHHFYFPKSPPAAVEGYLEVYSGPMFSDKSRVWKSQRNKILSKKGQDRIATFKWLDDTRYGQETQAQKKVFDLGEATLNNDETVPATLVSSVSDIRTYFHEYPHQRDIFIDEGQFFPGLFELVSEYLPFGYHFWITLLARGANRKVFGDGGRLVCLADKVNLSSAICVHCFEEATESHLLNQAGAKSGESKARVKVGGKGDYDARCLDCWNYGPRENGPFALDRFFPERLKK